MAEITMTIPGKPVAKKRPRFYRRGKGVGTYNDQETEEGRFMWFADSQWPGEPIESGIPVELTCKFYMPIPQSTSKKKREQMIFNLMKHTKKPDTDNLLKFVKDCLNGIAWHDDSQVWFTSGMKLYSGEPKTEIIVKW